ncbi:PLP-dependent aminotransferase family protein [Candidatus Marinarcus aquaticus]|uniref:GntR family transcriptional regulator n=1 Tax=Candidatus Marinarcus aquaticus TaxID=2044504 RepID=A0A4Q0XNM9_9BACT|nr:PLP-dependent aminotransferase family protein [Candidatus Marinarcus aquaticus]RXJ54146.1 GntR family transcriptional regulator [Candidatus Marinarcus aquaticus]
MYTLNPSSTTPLYIQLYEQIKKDIQLNLKAGSKLPSIRQFSSEYQISKTTVENTYAQLYAEGYIDSKPQSGYFVSDTNYKDFEQKQNIKRKPITKKRNYFYDFYPVHLPKESFPAKLWKRLSSKAIDKITDFSSYPDGQGEIELREEIVKYLIKSRGAKCDASQIVITSGFSESINLFAKMVQSKYKSFAIEDPGYHVARRTFESYGYTVEKINIDNNGLVIKELHNSNSKLVYITPSNQYPKGVTMPITNRLKLLKWAQKKDGLILEDDYDSELTYYNRPIPCLQGLDTFDKVVYFGTFSKSLSPALRISYMVLPYHLLPIYESYYDAHFSKVSLISQKTLTLFMKEGYYEKHLRKLRLLNKKRHEQLKTLLQQYLDNSMKIEAQGAGLAITINPTLAFDWDKFKTLAEENLIKLYFAKDTSGGKWEAIRMGFGGFENEETMQKAIELFSNIWYQSIKQ